MTTLHRKLLRDLLQLKGQVLTISLVVAAGIAAFISMKGNFTSILGAKERYYERSRFADVFVHLERAPESVRRDLEHIPGVARVETRVTGLATIPLASAVRPIQAQVISMPAGAQPGLNALHVVAGRLVEPGRDNEAVVLKPFAEAHDLAPGATLPVVLNGTWRNLKVVGLALSPEYVMTISPGAITQDPASFAVVWMGRRPMSAAFKMDGAFNDVSLTLQPGALVEAVLEEVDRRLEAYGGLGALPRARQLSNFIIDGEILQLNAMSNVVPAIFLAVAALLLNVVLSRLIHLQRPQIATLKAVGYSNREVGLHYLQLVLVVAALGAGLGMALGVYLGSAMTDLYTQFFRFPDLRFRLEAGPSLLSVGISLIAAVAGAFMAVRQVVSLPPAEAMRPPAPAKYRRSIIDRLGLGPVVGPSLHMILRELERRPLRSLGSALAIAASVGLLVVAGWYREGLDALMTTQFHEVMREDVLVGFAKPRPRRAIATLRHLPGVLDAEPLHVVPVRFRNGHRHREGSVFAYNEDSDLRTVRDKFGRPRSLPPTGVVLTDILRDILDIDVGDTIQVEVREGDRPTLHIPVVGFVDEGFGLQGHMRADVLADLLDQPPLMSSGLLRVDPDQVPSLQAALAELPHVVSVSLKADIVAQFRAQSGQAIAVMTLIISLFAATITIGVVYNNARIALSLRSRDLASLRVLGYTRSEISAILLGEMAVQVLVALPIGFWFGRVLVFGLASTVDPETYRLPIILSEASYAYAALVALAASAVSGLLVRRKLDKLDLIGVLKTRD